MTVSKGILFEDSIHSDTATMCMYIESKTKSQNKCKKHCENVQESVSPNMLILLYHIKDPVLLTKIKFNTLK